VFALIIASMEITTRAARLGASARQIYQRYADPANASELLPEGATGFRVEEGRIRFSTEVLGRSYDVTAEIDYKAENEAISVASVSGAPFPFRTTLAIAAKEAGCAVTIKQEAELDPLTAMLATSPIQRALDGVLKRLEARFPPK